MIVKSSRPRPKKNWFSWMRKERERNIERSGVLIPTIIDV